VGEFDLIKSYFSRPVKQALLGGGDDCALLAPLPPGEVLAVSSDMLVEGRHFLSTVSPRALGHKALAVNLSDLAACGAQPIAFTLALAMPRVEEAFVAGLAEGLYDLAAEHGIELVGGDTTAGPLNLCLTVMGSVAALQALRRGGARPGDAVWVSGCLGDARLALEAFRGTLSLSEAAFTAARRAMEWPQPRVALGRALRGLASSAIDVSDGLLGDLGHVLAASGVGASLRFEAMPRSVHLQAQTPAIQRLCLLTGGDDYELLFTAPAQRSDAVLAAAEACGVPVTCIGQIDTEPGLRVFGADERPMSLNGLQAFDHFASSPSAAARPTTHPRLG
jgi:thiamine-monophosphate kinase